VTRDERVAAIRQGARQLGQRLSADAAERLATLLGELARSNRRINLTAVRDPATMVSAHILDSLSVRPFLERDSVLDIGTGAGFPGLPLAIAEPQVAFTLLDANARKIAFVRHIVALLGLANAEAVQARAEDYAPGRRFDTVLARAVTSTAGLATLAAPLMADDGVLLALKGRYPDAELESLPADWTFTVTELSVPGLEDRARHLVSLRKEVAQ